MKPSASIVGNWRLASSISECDEFMHVTEDGRIVHFVFIDASGTRTMPMMLWSENLGRNRYRIRPEPGHEGWEIGMRPTPTGMEIDRAEENFPAKTFYAVPASDEELPAWFSDRLHSALVKMSEREGRPNEE